MTEVLNKHDAEVPASAADKTNTAVIKKCIGILGLIIMPVVSYVLFESVTGNLHSIIWQKAILNICFSYCIYLLLFAVSGTTRFSIPFASILLAIISMVEAFVVQFRDRPIMYWDILALKTALTVTQNYTFVLSEQMIKSIAVTAVSNIILFFFPFNLKGLKQRLIGFASSAVCIGCFMSFFFSYLMPKKNYEINVWDLNSTYEEDGYLLSTAISAKYVVAKAPSGYSQAKLAEIIDAVESDHSSAENADNSEVSETAYSDNASSQDNVLTAAANTGIQPVNIICIMNESFSDLSTAGEFTTNTDYMPFWHSLTENTIRGSLCVPVFGSMTSNTEYEFLTGDSISVLPFGSNAYQFNVSSGATSLVSTLKDQGYYSVAMHPYPAENWNRNTCYKDFGFDEFYDIEYYEGSEELRNYVSDKADFDKLIEQVENKTDSTDKLFIFNVTMQNHGGYSQSFDNFEQEVWLTGDMEGKYPQTDCYLSLIKKSDEAFEYLLDYFKNCDEPTMIVMFGDHQPAVEDEFFDELTGMPASEVPTADKLIWYQTPFVIWTNYEQPSADLGKLSSIYLSSYMLEASGLSMTPYNNFLLSLSEDVPVIHPNGCYDSDENYYYWGKAESERCPYVEEILDYKYLAYNHSLDSKKYTKAFVIDDSSDN